MNSTHEQIARNGSAGLHDDNQGTSGLKARGSRLDSRLNAQDSALRTQHSARSTFDFRLSTAYKILIPRRNERDVLTAEVFFAALPAVGEVAFEIAATHEERMFIVRGGAGAVDRVLSHVRAHFPQCEFERLDTSTDPAMRLTDVVGGMEVRLSEPMYLPLRTHYTREGRVDNSDMASAGDPMVGLLAAMDQLAPGEIALIQYVPRNMPRDWSKWFRGQHAEVDLRARLTPRHLLGAVALSAFFTCGALALMAALFASTLSVRGLWPAAVVCGALALGGLYVRFRLPSPPDPELVRQKVHQSAFRVCARVFVAAASEERGQKRLDEIAGAFEGYNLAGANGFNFVPLTEDATPAVSELQQEPEGVWQTLRAYWARAIHQQPILSMAEMANLWHLPHHAAALQDMAMVQSRQLAALPSQVRDGVFIGSSRLQGREVEVRLPKQALKGNIGLIAKTQSGKSNAMDILVGHVLREEPEAAVLVIDPHRTLAQAISRGVPEERRGKTIYWNLADTERPFGLNLLDARIGGAHMDKRIDDIVGTLRDIWPDNWGPRMETYFRGPLITMSLANEALLTDVGLEQWVHLAQASLTANREQIARAEFDDTAKEMIDDAARSILALKKPGRAGLARRYEQYLALARAWQAAANASNKPEMARAANALLAAVSKTDEGKRAGVRGEKLLERAYANPPRPLQYSLLDVSAMLLSSSFQTTALQGIDAQKHPHVFSFWRESYDAYKSMNVRLLLDMITPVTTKITRFLTSRVARGIFGQSETTLDIPEHLNQGGVLLIDLAAGVVGQDTAALVGATVLNTVAAQIFARQNSDAAPRPIYIVVDEFQSVPGADYSFMLSELAKYGVRLILGTQSLKLLDEVSRKTSVSWLNNTSTLFVFNTSADDAQVLARELGIGSEDALTVTPSDIVGLSAHNCFVRMKDDTATPTVFRVATRLADPGEKAMHDEIVARSRCTYGRDAAEVEEQLRLSSALRGVSDLGEAPANRFGGAGAAPKPTGFLDLAQALDQGKKAAVGDLEGHIAILKRLLVEDGFLPRDLAAQTKNPRYVGTLSVLASAGHDTMNVIRLVETYFSEEETSPDL